MLAAYLLTPTSVIVCLVLAVGLGAFAWPAFRPRTNGKWFSSYPAPSTWLVPFSTVYSHLASDKRGRWKATRAKRKKTLNSMRTLTLQLLRITHDTSVSRFRHNRL
ncbi:unnamed protein product [Nesidiocoris tenuis]|uniref:Uncharacterized protein n=1 Tax=Nesidiocoris tenuis TaxID=355587 RepID=A0A6H5HI19_9HEMI|nr:unnamed protein product [Nesidiocoris tenuis]